MPTTAPLPLQSSTPLTDKHLLKFCRQDRMQAGSLIISLFGDAIYPRGGKVWLGCLIQLLSPLAVNERLIRTAIFRLVKEEWLVPTTAGRRTDYGLSTSGIQRMEEASKYIYAPSSPEWDNNWRILMLSSATSTADRDRLRKALVWQGFGPWQNHAFVHPGADLKITMALLEREGLGHLLGHCWPLLAQSLPLGKGQTDRQVVAAMWDVKQLANSYKKFSSIYQPLIAEWLSLGSKPTNNHMEKAFWLRLLLIHDFRRLLLRDPSLPLNLLPAQWPGQAARQTCMALYGLLRPASEKYLDLHVQLADGQLTSSRKVFAQRFKKC
jgi:phenylacetic acid degradation operon negative regulatory protein